MSHTVIRYCIQRCIPWLSQIISGCNDLNDILQNERDVDTHHDMMCFACYYFGNVLGSLVRSSFCNTMSPKFSVSY